VHRAGRDLKKLRHIGHRKAQAAVHRFEPKCLIHAGWSPLLTAVSGYDLIVPPGSTQEIAQRLELKRADKGFNVTLHECSEFALQHRSQIEGRKGWFASPIVLYLELAEAGGRSRELAMAIKRNLIAKGENHG